jgi:isocitrate dehydrogenase (NAD+)
MAHKITMIPGDGSGPDIVVEAKRCIDATGVKINWEIVEAGLGALEKKGDPLPQEVLDSIEKNHVALKGPITTPSGTGYRSINVQLRQHFELFACVRPCKTMRGLKGCINNVDLVVIRENIEDLYAGIEFKDGEESTKELIEMVRKHSGREITIDSSIALKPISKSASKRIAHFAFKYAQGNRRRKVTVVTKANIMKFTDGLFYEEAEKVAREYPSIDFEHLLIDNACLHLVSSPQNFDLLLAPNLYGDIVSDLCAALVGGLGMVPGANLGEGCAVFEAVHGSAPKYKGKNVMNPCALILSGAMMLQYLGETEAAHRLKSAVEAVIEEGRYLTKDLNRKSPVGTKEMADRIIRFLDR